MKFYHIQRFGYDVPEWKLNDVHSTSEESENYFQKAIEIGIRKISSTRHKNLRFLEYANDFLKNNNSTTIIKGDDDIEEQNLQLADMCSSYEDLALKLLKCSAQYMKWIREEIFERVRADSFKDLPSRKNCLWVCDNENIRFWWNEIAKNGRKKIVEIEMIGDYKIHRADERYVKIDSFSLGELSDNARKYWSGEMINDSRIEILLEGKFKIINVFNDLNSLN